MKSRLKRCGLLVLLILSPVVGIADEPTAESPAPPKEPGVDIEALADRAEAMLPWIRAHHIQPPSDGEMWRKGTLGLKDDLLREHDLERARRLLPQTPEPQLPAHQLNTAAERRQFLTEIWSKQISPKLIPRQVHRLDLLRHFVRAMLPEGADLVPGNEYKIEERVRANRYTGTGIALGADEALGYPQIAGLIPGGPMERAGGRNKDLIVKIDGQDTHDWTVSQVRDALSGEEGTKVTVELKQGANSPTRTVVVTRGTILFPALAGMPGSTDNYRIKPGLPIRYVGISRIDGSTVHDLRSLEGAFRRDGVRAVIFDLRNFQGDDLHSALLLADALLDGGTIGRLRTRSRVQEFHADRDRLFRGLELAVLANEMTSGSGEWLAAALQDNAAATIVGGRTAGSSLVKTFIHIPETNEYLQLATGRFERPNRSIHERQGWNGDSDAGHVIPDLVIDGNQKSPTVVPGPVREFAFRAILRPLELKPHDSDPALSAAIEELMRRIRHSQDQPVDNVAN